MEDRDGIIGWLVILGLVFWWGSSHEKKTAEPAAAPSFGIPAGRSSYSPSYSVGSDNVTLSRDEAIADHWDEIKEYLNGSETIEACSLQSGNCYDLDADISSGSIDTIHFPNGGWKNLAGDVDSDGSASDMDNDGDSWDMNLDMNSSSVDDAIQEWADSNGVEIR